MHLKNNNFLSFKSRKTLESCGFFGFCVTNVLLTRY
nr:MAG TPA: hypothetical protein [Caudoviricetes sp.]